MDKFFINSEEAALIILDMQERLAAAMKTRQQTVDNGLHLIETAKLFQIPILVTEQYPKGLGADPFGNQGGPSGLFPFRKDFL